MNAVTEKPAYNAGIQNGDILTQIDKNANYIDEGIPGSGRKDDLRPDGAHYCAAERARTATRSWSLDVTVGSR